MLKTRHGKASLVALGAAVVLVLQLFLAGWSSAAMASAPVLDAFGNPICTDGTDATGTGGSPSAPAHMPDCCLSGCSATAAPFAMPDLAVASVARPLPVFGPALQIPAPIVAAAPDHDPGSPRGPPASA